MFHDCIIYRAKEYTSGVNSNMTNSACSKITVLTSMLPKCLITQFKNLHCKNEIEHGQKLTLHWFQNDTALHFEPYWKLENAANINFWRFLKLNY